MRSRLDTAGNDSDNLRSHVCGLPIRAPHCGGLAQLGERLHGMQEVRGSSPLSSIGRRPIESRQEKVESRKIRDLEIFWGQRTFITTQLSPVYSVNFLLTTLFLCSASGVQPWSSQLAFTFEKLLVYQKYVDFADQVCDPTEQFST